MQPQSRFRRLARAEGTIPPVLRGRDEPRRGRVLGPTASGPGQRRGESHAGLGGGQAAARRTPASLGEKRPRPPHAPPGPALRTALRRGGAAGPGRTHTPHLPPGRRRGHYLSEHLAAAVALPRRGVGYNPGDLGGVVGVVVLVRLLLRLLPPGLAARRSARRPLAALGSAAAAARRVGDGPQQLHLRALPAPSCPPGQAPLCCAPLCPAPPAAPAPPRRRAAPRLAPYMAGGGSAPALADGPRRGPAPPARRGPAPPRGGPSGAGPERGPGAASRAAGGEGAKKPARVLGEPGRAPLGPPCSALRLRWLLCPPPPPGRELGEGNLGGRCVLPTRLLLLAGQAESLVDDPCCGLRGQPPHTGLLLPVRKGGNRSHLCRSGSSTAESQRLFLISA